MQPGLRALMRASLTQIAARPPRSEAPGQLQREVRVDAAVHGALERRLRERGAERFIAFLTDRDFKLTLNDDELRWGKPVISGAVLYGLAKPSEGEALFLEVPGGEDRQIEHGELIDLSEPGIERFITARLTFEIIVNSRPRTVNVRTVTFEQIVQLAFPGQHEPNVVFSMTYRHAASTPHAGELGAGGTVNVKKKGTVFNVTRTVQS